MRQTASSLSYAGLHRPCCELTPGLIRRWEAEVKKKARTCPRSPGESRAGRSPLVFQASRLQAMLRPLLLHLCGPTEPDVCRGTDLHSEQLHHAEGLSGRLLACHCTDGGGFPGRVCLPPAEQRADQESGVSTCSLRPSQTGVAALLGTAPRQAERAFYQLDFSQHQSTAFPELRGFQGGPC